MAFPLQAWQVALYAAKAQLTSNQGLALLRQSGAGVRRETWQGLYRMAVTVVRQAGEEPFRDEASVPAGNEIAGFPMGKRTGFAQNVTLVYRERGTGNLVTARHTTYGSSLVTRAQAIQNAAQAYAGTEEEYDQELVGVSYTSTFRYTPVGVA